MKIAVVHNLPPGGQKRALYNQVGLLSQNHEIDLFTLSSTDEKFKSLKPFVRKHFTVNYVCPSYFPLNLLSIYINLPQAYKKIADLINIGDYKVAYINPCWLTQAPYVLRFLRIPSLYYCPEPKREFYEKIPRLSNKWRYLANYPFRIPIKYIDKKNTQSADIILTNSYYSKERVEKIYKVRAKVNYLGVNPSVFKPEGKIKENLVISVGEFSLLKGHDFIINCLASIDKETRPSLIIVGTQGIEKDYLLALAKEKKVDLSLYQNISDRKLVSLYNKSRIFIYAAYHEPFGLSILEALACGLRIVAVSQGGFSEIFKNNSFGYLIKREKKKFTQAIKWALNKPWDKKRVEKQIAWVKKRWSWEKSVKEMEKYLLKI